MKAFIQQKESHGSKMVLQSLVPFLELSKSAVFTCRANPNLSTDKTEKIAEVSYEYYQRKMDSSRIHDIENFIMNSILDEKENVILATLFPSSMILAINSEENNIRSTEGEETELELKKNVFIVDGQHRLMAMKKVYEKLQENDNILGADTEFVRNYIEKYKFNCVILVDYDLWEQGQIFINVNFKQKPVNKSLYYEVFGAEYKENKKDWGRNKIYLAHCLAKSLNEDKRSPYYERVKMLGTGVGYISQAFVVEAILPHFNKGGIWEYQNESPALKTDDYKFFATELLSYYSAIKEMFLSYWPHKEETKGTIVCKSTGFAAFCQLMRLIRTPDDYEMITALKSSTTGHELCQVYMNRVKKVLSPIKKREKILFGKDSILKSTSGKGAQIVLRNRLLSILSLDAKILKIPQRWIKTLDLEEVSEKIYDYLQEYAYSNEISEIVSLCNHYENLEVTDLTFTDIKEDNDSLNVHCNFNLGAVLYLDETDEVKFKMVFPCQCFVALRRNDQSILKMDELKVDVSKFYT